MFDLSYRPRGRARARTSIVIPVICLVPLLVGTTAAASWNKEEGHAHLVAAAAFNQSSGTGERKPLNEVERTRILAQRVDKTQSAPPQPAPRPAAAAPQGTITAKEQQRPPAETPAHDTTSLPADRGAAQPASEAERVNQQLLLDQERQRREQLARELASVRAELDAARQIQTHTARAIEIGIQQTQALEQEREKASNLSRELSFLRAELDVARVAASKAMQASEVELKQECPLDRRNGAKRFSLQLASLRSELDGARNAVSEATNSAATEAERRQALERELKQEQDKTEALINELGALRTSASETVKINAADSAEKQALRRELEKQRDRADSTVRQLDSSQAELRAAQSAASELTAHRAADVEQQRVLERDLEQQRSRADALARETTSLRNERDAARAEVSDAARAAEAVAKAQVKREKEQASSGKPPPPTSASVGDQLAAWSAFAAVIAPSRSDQSRAPTQSVIQSPAPPSPKPPTPAATPPNVQLTTGSVPSGATERAAAASAAARPLANEERLLARASALLRQADINGARGLLEYILGHGSAQAAFMLAETYDPHMLQSWDARGVAGDSAKARELYERARAGGIQDADGRIKGLR
ncbi:hypothetical protein [Bradyrhizobium sp. B117]|uniref:hypothetical protein n=1 Tax=Bradyrhizobium sp. B117 TaxID=3140246 RepID=UPI003184416B